MTVDEAMRELYNGLGLQDFNISAHPCGET